MPHIAALLLLSLVQHLCPETSRQRSILAAPTVGSAAGEDKKPGLVFEGISILFDDRVGEDLAGDAVDLRFGFGLAEFAVERKLEIFALAHIPQSLVAHLLQRALDGLALWIQDTLLERHINVSSHGCFNYTVGGNWPPARLSQSNRRRGFSLGAGERVAESVALQVVKLPVEIGQGTLKHFGASREASSSCRTRRRDSDRPSILRRSWAWSGVSVERER